MSDVRNDILDQRISELLQGGNRFVELGCGAGYVIDEVSKKYDESFGFDVSDGRLNLRENEKLAWEFIKADLNNRIELEDNSVTAIYANQVIEHIVNPFFFIGEIYRVLEVGGVAIITTPNIRYIKHLLKLIFSGDGPKTANNNDFDGAWDDGHLHYFTHKDLYGICKQIGFINITSNGFVNNPKSNLIRSFIDSYSYIRFVKEFLSGNILFVLTK